MAIKPTDVLKDSENTAFFNGNLVRKGTIKAAIENAKIMNSESASNSEKQQARQMFEELIPDMIALELHIHVVWKDPEIQEMFAKHL